MRIAGVATGEGATEVDVVMGRWGVEWLRMIDLFVVGGWALVDGGVVGGDVDDDGFRCCCGGVSPCWWRMIVG